MAVDLYSNSEGLFPTLRVFEVFPDTIVVIPGEYDLAFPTEFEDAYLLERAEMWPEENKRLTRK